MGMPDRGMAPERKFGLDGVFMKKSGLWPTFGSPWKSTFSGCDPIDLKNFLQCLDEALITLGLARGGLQEATTAELELNAAGES